MRKLAELYRKHRRDGLAASVALAWAREQLATDAFEWRAEQVSRFKTSFCNQEGAEVWEIESASGRLRVELAVMPDYDGRDDDAEDADAAELWRFFREEKKLGRTAAREAVAESLEKQAAYRRARERGDYQSVGVGVRVFWNVPRLEAGEPIAEDYCYGYETDGSDVWQFVREIYQNATHGLCAKLREIRQAERRALMAEAFAANFTI